MFKRHAVLWFIVITVALSFATYFLPLPAEQKSLLVPVVLVLIPALVSVPVALISEGSDGLRQILSTASLRRGGLKWLLIGVGLGVLIRVMIWGMALLLQLSVRADLSDPGAWFVLLATIPLALFEEIGWRSYALDRVLRKYSPLEASLLIGLPWGLLHLVIVLPGMMNQGVPAIAQVGSVILMSIVLTWAYVRSGHSLWTVTLLHGVQNGLVVLNRGLSIVSGSWLLVAVCFILATVLITVDRRLFFTRPEREASGSPQPALS
jgi:membrane protease YdiL (CAAX protease family)